MKTPRWMAAVGLGVVVGMAVTVPMTAQAQRQLRKAQKLLDKIKLVDGAGSGLDADTLRGVAPGSGLDADTLQGMAPNAFLGAGAKAADANALDGIDSTGFLKVDDVFTRNYSCAGSTFGAIQDTDAFSTSDSLRYGSGQFRCNVALPDGATVTGVRFSVRDDSATAGVSSCEMWRTNMTTDIGMETQMADAGFTGSAATPGLATLATTTITEAVIDNANFAYFIQCSIGGTASDVGLFGANISYTITGGGGAGLVAREPAPVSGRSSTDE